MSDFFIDGLILLLFVGAVSISFTGYAISSHNKDVCLEKGFTDQARDKDVNQIYCYKIVNNTIIKEYLELPWYMK